MDVPEHRDRILRRELPPAPLWIFDEIHKYRLWRNYLKGLYDGKAPGQRILVTGSAWLDYYRYSGDSLQGRYHLLHDRGLRYLKARFPEAEAWQISATGKKDFVSPESIRVCPAPLYLSGLV